MKAGGNPLNQLSPHQSHGASSAHPGSSHVPKSYVLSSASHPHCLLLQLQLQPCPLQAAAPCTASQGWKALLGYCLCSALALRMTSQSFPFEDSIITLLVPLWVISGVAQQWCGWPSRTPVTSVWWLQDVWAHMWQRLAGGSGAVGPSWGSLMLVPPTHEGGKVKGTCQGVSMSVPGTGSFAGSGQGRQQPEPCTRSERLHPRDARQGRRWVPSCFPSCSSSEAAPVEGAKRRQPPGGGGSVRGPSRAAR